MIAIAGGTGVVGSAVARELLRRGEAVRVLVRSDATEESWSQRGAETVRGDVTAANSLNALCRGADTLVITASALLRSGADTIDAVDLAGSRHLVDAAHRTGVKCVVFVSAAAASSTSRIPFLRAKGIVEEYVMRTSESWTIIAPHLLMETWIEMIVGVPVRAGQPVTLAGIGRALHSFISANDVAAFVVAAALGQIGPNRRIAVGGTLPVSWHEVVEECTALVDRPIDIRAIPPGFPYPHIAEPLGSTLALMMAALDQRDIVIDSAGLYRELGIEPTSLRSFLVAMLADRRRPFRDQPAAAPTNGAPFELPPSSPVGEEPPAPSPGEATDRTGARGRP